MIAFNGPAAVSQDEAAELYERLARLGAALILSTGPRLPTQPPPPPAASAAPLPAAAASAVAVGDEAGAWAPRAATSWAVLAGDDRRRWQAFGDSFRLACVDALARAGTELSRDGLAQLLADHVGLPHWQDDPAWGKAGYEALKGKVSSEMVRLVRSGRVVVRSVATGRRGETRLMWRVPAVLAEPALVGAGSSGTWAGIGTGAGPGGMRPFTAMERTPSHD